MRNLASLAFISVVALGVNPSTLPAQTGQPVPPAPAAPAQRGPDLLGVYPGMRAAEARRRLQTRSDANRVQDIVPNKPEFGFYLQVNDPEGGGGENIKVYITAPQNPPVVWAIARDANYFPGHEVATSTLLGSLRQKYGTETASRSNGSTGTAFWWVFDQNGQRVASGDSRALGTCQAAFQNNTTLGQTGLPPSPYAPWLPCFTSYYALYVYVGQGTSPELVNNFTASFVNLPLGYRAGLATMNAKNAAAEAARKQELEKAKQKKPVF